MNYPKTLDANIKYRGEILTKCNTDLSYRNLVKKAFYEDPLFAFNLFYYTLDVRRRPLHHQPFCTYNYQDNLILKVIESIDSGQDLVIEKSRDMGCSWIIILVFLWFWLKPAGGVDFLLGSRIEDYVDKKGDMRTLLEKARYALYHLPKWLLPEGFNTKKHDNFMRLQNPETRSSITGESNNANFSTGGRYAGVLFDEFAKWEGTDMSAWTAAGDATPCRIALSTPFGASGKYYELVTDGRTEKVNLHWAKHPMKNDGAYCEYPLKTAVKTRSPWYDRQCQRRTPSEIAQELDINYLGAGNPVFDGLAGERVNGLLQLSKKPLDIIEIDMASFTYHKLEEAPDFIGLLIMWEQVSENIEYSIGVDVAEGKEGGDYSVVKILNRNNSSLAASYYSHLDEVQLAKIIKVISSIFNTPWIGIEVNGPGLATFDLCVEYDVPMLFMMPSYDVSKGSVSYKKGWRTTNISRNVLIAGIKEWLQIGEGFVDKRCVRELTTFVKNKVGRGEAKSGCNDDEVIAFGIALQVHVNAPIMGIDEKEEPMSIFDIQPTDEPTSIEDRCMATILRKRDEYEEQNG